MRTLICLMASVLAVAVSASAAVVPSRIESVTVFTDQARVVRSA